jgi:UDP-glucose 4-epimerase
LQETLDLFNVSVLTKSHRKLEIKGNFNLILADLMNSSQLCNELKNKDFSYVIHAGSVNDSFVENYRDLAYQVNTFGTRNLLDALNMDKVKHFIYLSTFQVYGKYDGLINEGSETNPLNDYGMSHLFAEYVLALQLRNPKYSIIRLTNSYGCPKDVNTSKWHLITNDLAKMAFDEKKIKLNSNGNALRDFIWMGDVCYILRELLGKKPQNQIYNLSRGKSLTLKSVANKVQSAYQQYYNELLPIQLNDEDQTHHSSTLSVNMSKLKKLVNFEYHDELINESINIFKLLEGKKLQD